MEDLGEFCDAFAKNALQEVLFSSGLAKGGEKSETSDMYVPGSQVQTPPG